MIAKVVTAGRGFVGLVKYLTDGARAAWVEARNLPTQDAQLGARMMAATAASQAAIKAAAGVSTRGRKCHDPLLHIAISWRDGEQPTRDEQMAAADALLDELGLGDHQALIVAHVDKDHHHIHVGVNRVSLDDGRTARLGYFKRTCSTWASDYERAKGEIQCPRREVVRKAHEAGIPIPPRPQPAPSIRRDRATGRPLPRTPGETAIWRHCRAESLAAGDDRDQARARRVSYARQLEATRPALPAVEDTPPTPPLQPAGRSLAELRAALRDEAERRYEAEQWAARHRAAAAKRRATESRTSRPVAAPAEDRPVAAPAEDRPVAAPAEDRPAAAPAEDRTAAAPAEDRTSRPAGPEDRYVSESTDPGSPVRLSADDGLKRDAPQPSRTQDPTR